MRTILLLGLLCFTSVVNAKWFLTKVQSERSGQMTVVGVEVDATQRMRGGLVCFPDDDIMSLRITSPVPLGSNAFKREMYWYTDEHDGTLPIQAWNNVAHHAMQLTSSMHMLSAMLRAEQSGDPTMYVEFPTEGEFTIKASVGLVGFREAYWRVLQSCPH